MPTESHSPLRHHHPHISSPQLAAAWCNVT